MEKGIIQKRYNGEFNKGMIMEMLNRLFEKLLRLRLAISTR